MVDLSHKAIFFGESHLQLLLDALSLGDVADADDRLGKRACLVVEIGGVVLYPAELSRLRVDAQLKRGVLGPFDPPPLDLFHYVGEILGIDHVLHAQVRRVLHRVSENSRGCRTEILR
ncbi:MAG: hypothetical protein GVY14_09420 [Spirochaetes bacterium]|nr:hypothetical protein [Spirochaetota bacterium]